MSVLKDVLQDAKGTKEFGTPRAPGEPPLTAAERRIRPCFRVESVSELGTNNLMLQVRYGRHKDEDLGVPLGEDSTDDTPLGDLAPTRAYRVVILPPTAGTTGLLAVESIGGACPTMYVLKWIRRWMYDRAQATLGHENEWYKLRAFAAADHDRLKKYLNQAALDHAVLIRRSVADSRLRSDEIFRIEAGIFDNSEADLRELAKGVLVRESDEAEGERDDLLDDPSLADEVGQAIEEEDSIAAADATFASAMGSLLGGGLGELTYDDGYLVLDTDTGKEAVSPSRLPEVFTYPVSSDRPSDAGLRAEIKVKALSIRKEIGATIDLSSW
ncbi:MULTISPECIES: hypothetical protein [unclassified Dietzia]|uniref:hypothetical protein n=1 Tax=unclassified Dietzia TaxID=2617939 RepID=UPI0015F866D8|nr:MULTISPECIES: hypothetical protein [unclassified Dietzia]MBB1023331.1 hypothetical protein [Dietzia sp. DQ12-76]MBB1026490.1 hypothetical protein [Dietzia sp. DQ11-38-2]